MRSSTAPPKEKTRPQEETDTTTKQMPPYNVVLLNDNDHSFEYVIHMLQKVFGHPRERGYQLAWEVHTQDRVIVYTTYKELAELKRDQVHSFGKDTSIARCKGSMTAVVEPAPG